MRAWNSHLQAISRFFLAFLFALAVCGLLYPRSAISQETAASQSPKSVEVPRAEQTLIDILSSVQKEYATDRSATRASDARLAAQIRVAHFMRDNPQAIDWSGTIKSRGLTADGDTTISIEIADDITVSTLKSSDDNAGVVTVIRPSSGLFAALKGAKLGRPVTFSGYLARYERSDDADMILHPSFIMIFTKLTIPDVK